MESYRVSKQLAEKKNLLLSDSDEDVARRIDTLKFQIKEIESAELKLGEEETIQREHEMLGQAQHIIGLIHVALNDLTENESSAFSCMVTVQKALNELYPLVDKASEWQNEARAIAIQIQELSSEASRLVQDINQDPARLQWLDERLNLYRKTKRKYGNNIEDVFQHLERSRKTLKELYAREEHINKIDSELQATQSLMHKKGKKLSMLRKENAASLSEAVAFELRALGFGHGSFDIAVSDTTPGTSGMNEIDFQFAPNKGESMRPMRLIASSGEISRVMLAIKSILAAHDKVPTLIFDEIDMNIGGTTARAVGFKLAGLATQRQILCITHLPQVAVHGTTHFSVAKKQKNGRTITEINLIKKNKRVEEIARMLGGRDSTAVAWRHAKELLDKAKLT